MKFLRRHPYLITLALLLVVFPVPVLAQSVIESAVFTLVTNVLGMFVYFGAMLLNFGINHFVIGFGDVYAKTGVGYAVDTTWIIIRDFVNMAFIFGFVYIGFKMILSSNDSNTRRWLVNLLLAALLVNFSLFITKVTIDFSNQLAAQIVVGGLKSEGGKIDDKTGLYQVDLGGSFMDRMGITSIWRHPPKDAAWSYIFGSAILFMVTAFVFAAGGILLIIRFAVLNLFLVLSPLMFLSWILPPLKETMNRYWGMFLGRVFFAPIYLLFIYFSLQIITGLQTAIGDNKSNLANPDWAGTFQAVEASSKGVQDSTLGTLPFFVLICIFMIASLVIAQKMGADGGMKAVALGKDWGKRTSKFAAAQTGGRLARATANASGNAVNRGLRNLQQSDNKFVRGLARSNAVQGTVGGAADSLKKSKFGLGRTIEEDTKMRYETEQRANKGMAVTAGLDAQKKQDGGATLNPAELAALEEMKKVAGSLEQKEFEQLTEEQQTLIAGYLSDSQAEKIGKSEKISDEQKAKITTARQEAFKRTVAQNGEILTEELTKLTTSQLETLGEQFILDNIEHFSKSQFDDLKKSKNFSQSQVQGFSSKRKAKITDRSVPPENLFENQAINTATGARRRTGKKRAADIANLPGEVLARTSSLSHLNVDVLKAIANGDTKFENVSTSERMTIKQNIMNVVRGSSPEITMMQDFLRTAKGGEFINGK